MGPSRVRTAVSSALPWPATASSSPSVNITNTSPTARSNTDSVNFTASKQPTRGPGAPIHVDRAVVPYDQRVGVAPQRHRHLGAHALPGLDRSEGHRAETLRILVRLHHHRVEPVEGVGGRPRIGGDGAQRPAGGSRERGRPSAFPTHVADHHRTSGADPDHVIEVAPDLLAVGDVVAGLDVEARHLRQARGEKPVLQRASHVLGRAPQLGLQGHRLLG